MPTRHAHLQPDPLLGRPLAWRRPDAVAVPDRVLDWLEDDGSLTRRLQRHGQFRVQSLFQGIITPRPEERWLLALPARQRALVREVRLLLDGTPVVFARSVLPLDSLSGANRVLGHMAKRSLGAELFKAPRATRQAVWFSHYPEDLLPASLACPGAWGRQSRFLKRGKPLLVAEVFLPALWQRIGQHR